MKSKELQEMEAADLEQEPSLDKMVDLNNPKVLEGLGRLVEQLRNEGRIASARAKEIADDLNRPETEEDGFRAEALRRLKVRLSSRAPQDPTQPLSLSRSNMLPTTASTSADKPVTQK